MKSALSFLATCFAIAAAIPISAMGASYSGATISVQLQAGASPQTVIVSCPSGTAALGGGYYGLTTETVGSVLVPSLVVLISQPGNPSGGPQTNQWTFYVTANRTNTYYFYTTCATP